MRLPYNGITWGPFFTSCLLLQVVLNLIYFWVAPVSEMINSSRLMRRLPLHVFLVLLSFDKLRALTIRLLLLAQDHNHQIPGERTKVMTTIFVVVVVSFLWPLLVLLHGNLLWSHTPCIYQ